MRYSKEFYRGEEECALRSARHVMPYVLELTDAKSVIDVGCGTGGWLSVAKEHGARVLGMDSYTGKTLLEPDEFVQCDIANGVKCGGYDLALCLEVAEHLDESSAKPLVAGLCEAKWVLFSGAHPGQNGVHHVNEQWATWWAELFRDHGYVGVPDIRWQFWENREVADFYRENMVLYAKRPVGMVVDVIHPERLGQW